MSPNTFSTAKGFSIIELLTVIGIIALLAAAVMPAFNSIRGGANVTGTAAGIEDLLENARSYAMGKNTYVYVGLQEVDGITPTENDGIGRLAVGVVASQDGTRPYTASGALTTNIVAISKVVRYDGMHLSKSSELSTAGNMSRPTSGSGLYDLGSSNTAITFNLPIGGTAKYKFKRVIEFDPQGVARSFANTRGKTIPAWIEIPLLPAKGNVTLTSSENQAALQIDGITGSVRTYRP